MEQTLNCYEIQNCISGGTADVGIHYGVGGYAPSVVTEQIASCPLILLASSALATEDLASHALQAIPTDLRDKHISIVVAYQKTNGLARQWNCLFVL